MRTKITENISHKWIDSSQFWNVCIWINIYVVFVTSLEERKSIQQKPYSKTKYVFFKGICDDMRIAGNVNII